MHVKQLIEASAEVVTITRLRKGDVYKRVHSPYASSDPKLQFGIVTDVMHNGTDAAITAVEYQVLYAGVEVEVRVFTADTEPALFPATVEEIREHFASIQEALDRKVDAAARELDKAERVREAGINVLDAAERGQLSAPQTVRGDLRELAPHIAPDEL
jgi:hypothetical protein